MQSFVPPPERNPSGKTRAQILTALHASTRHLTFRYELYDRYRNLKLANLDGVEYCRIEQNWLAKIKRVAQLRIRDLGLIDYLSDYVKPLIRLNFADGTWCEWPQGLFLLSSPKRSISKAGTVTREVAAYDRTLELDQDKPPGRLKLLSSTDVLDAVYVHLGYLSAQGFRPPGPPLVRSTIREWEPGTSRLTVVNDLLDMINFESLAYDEDGNDSVRPYVLPSGRAEEYVYADGSDGLIVPEMDQELDVFDVPNQWTRTVSEPDRPIISATYTNANPASPTSTVRRGRVISDSAIETDAITLAVLQAKVSRLAFESSQAYEAIDFSTAIMPFHSGNDCYRIRYSPLAIDAKYLEHTWSMELRAGAPMQHRARRTVTI